MLFTIIYFLFVSIAFTSIIISTLERRCTKYGLGSSAAGNYILPASMLFVMSYMGNIVLRAVLPDVIFVLAQVLGAAGTLAFAALMEWRSRKEAGLFRQEMLEEIEALRKEAGKDPANAAWLERLAELYRKTGDMKEAVAAAEKAFALDPSKPNKWRLEALKEAPRPEPEVPGLITGYFRFLAGLLRDPGRLFRVRTRGPE